MSTSNNPENKAGFIEALRGRKNEIIAGSIGFIVCILIEGFVVFIFQEWIKDRYFSNEAKIEVKYDTIVSTPYTYDSKGSLRFDYKTDKKINEFWFEIINSGNGPANDFKIDIRTISKDLKIIEPLIAFEPFGIEENIKPSPRKNDSNRFYRLINPFPGGGAKICLGLKFSNKISENDLVCSFISRGKIWRLHKDEINLLTPLSIFEKFPQAVSVAFAQEVRKEVKEASNNKLKSFWFGGYYPLVIAHGIFKLLCNKDILKNSEIKEIEDMIESFELVSKGITLHGVSTQVSNLFRGFSFSRFHEIILNALIRNKKISIEEAKQILKTSREAGGTKISGINFLVLDVEILNYLLRSGFISRTEGQQIIDNAKVIEKSNK